jgi:hypothetical protein
MGLRIPYRSVVDFGIGHGLDRKKVNGYGDAYLSVLTSFTRRLSTHRISVFVLAVLVLRLDSCMK